MHPAIVHEEQLKQAFHCRQRGSLEKLLRSQGIRVLYGKNGEIVTTVDALNRAMGVVTQDQEDEVDLA